MDQRTKGIIATVASLLLCGCPGLFLCVFGAASAFGGGTYDLGGQAGNISPTVGYVLICLSFLLLLIPGAVDESPLPPTS